MIAKFHTVAVNNFAGEKTFAVFAGELSKATNIKCTKHEHVLEFIHNVCACRCDTMLPAT